MNILKLVYEISIAHIHKGKWSKMAKLQNLCQYCVYQPGFSKAKKVSSPIKFTRRWIFCCEINGHCCRNIAGRQTTLVCCLRPHQSRLSSENIFSELRDLALTMVN